MDPSTYEQFGADRDAVGEAEKWLKEQERYEITLYNGTPLAVTPPNFIELEITETDPGPKGRYGAGGQQACHPEHWGGGAGAAVYHRG
jgi:elongation factor P